MTHRTQPEIIRKALANAKHALTTAEIFDDLLTAEERRRFVNKKNVSKTLNALRTRGEVKNGISEIIFGKTALTWLLVNDTPQPTDHIPDAGKMVQEPENHIVDEHEIVPSTENQSEDILEMVQQPTASEAPGAYIVEERQTMTEQTNIDQAINLLEQAKAIIANQKPAVKDIIAKLTVLHELEQITLLSERATQTIRAIIADYESAE